MKLIKLFPDSEDIDTIAKTPLELFPDNLPLQLETMYLNKEFLQHAYLVKSGDQTLGGIAFYDNPGHYLQGERACCAGYFHSVDDQEVANLLIDAVKKDSIALGRKYLIGPLNGTTWENYRFRTTDAPPSFFLESAHPVYYNRLFVNAGFFELKKYYSFLVQPLQAISPRILKREQRLIEAGITFRNINYQQYAEDMQKIHECCLVSFKNNFLYTPYSWDAFINKYKLLESVANPDMTVLAEHKGQVVGFIFMIDDYMCRTQKRLVFKTYAVRPGKQYAGLGAVLSQRLTHQLMNKGYEAAIHAFVIEGSASMNMSSKDAELYRTYQLYAMKCEQA